MDDSWTSGHPCGLWGGLRSLDGDLYSLGDLVRMVAACEDLPLRPAAFKVLDRLEQHAAFVLYVTQPEDWALRIDGDAFLTVGRHKAKRVGLQDIFKALRSFWTDRLASEEDLYRSIGRGGPAVLQAQADEIFPEWAGAFQYSWHKPLPPDDDSLNTASVDVQSEAQERVQRVEPEGGSWPRIAGGSWTDAERIAMFKMRHLHKFNGGELAAIVGVSRQRINEQIGPAKLVGKWWEGLPWVPSRALIQECCSPVPTLPPLHAVVDDLTRIDS